jgi:hypothetical protein
MNFIAQPNDDEPFFATGKDIKYGLQEFIKKSGLTGFKDYYMSVKEGKNTHIPAGVEKRAFFTND